MWKPATIENDSEIIEMCAELYREDPSPESISDLNIKNTLAELRSNPIRGQALVLSLDGVVQGYALLISFWSNELNGEIGMIDELYVRPTLRGKGRGSDLIRSLMKKEFTLTRPLAALDLEVTPTNERAKKLYIGLGFRQAKNTHMRFRF